MVVRSICINSFKVNTKSDIILITYLDRSQQRVRTQRRKLTHIDSSTEDLMVPAVVTEVRIVSPTEKNITWTGIVREALLSLGI
jgi:hypothetical protein